jgi:hypothetical protein
MKTCLLRFIWQMLPAQQHSSTAARQACQGAQDTWPLMITAQIHRFQLLKKQQKTVFCAVVSSQLQSQATMPSAGASNSKVTARQWHPPLCTGMLTAGLGVGLF